LGWEKGSVGAAALAQAVVDATADKPTPELHHLYDLEDPVETKIRKLATKIYGATDISLSEKAKEEIAWIERHNLHKVPICMAKTPLSFSHDPELKGEPKDYIFPITNVRLSNGAGFIYPLAGAMQTMPGLSTRPGFVDIDVDKEGVVKGLF
jgi:formyltetrahydrofolate synthetase